MGSYRIAFVPRECLCLTGRTPLTSSLGRKDPGEFKTGLALCSVDVNRSRSDIVITAVEPVCEKGTENSPAAIDRLWIVQAKKVHDAQ